MTHFKHNAGLMQRTPRWLPYAMAGLLAVIPGMCLAAESSHWIADANGCKVYNESPSPGESITWSGGCQDGFAEGPGTLQWNRSNGKLGTRIEATYAHGQPEGPGKVFSPNGTRFEGNYSAGAPQGPGVMVFPDGERYEREFDRGRRSGHGVLTSPSGIRYEGQFVNGRFNGTGTYVSTEGVSYEGEWRDGVRQGHGIFATSSGERWEGEWKDDQPVDPGAPAGAKAAPVQHPGDGNFSLKEEHTGSHVLRKSWVGLPVPPDRPYRELTPEQQNRVKSQYEVMADDDEPPYPLHGQKELLAAVRTVRSHVSRRGGDIFGEVSMAVTVNDKGKPTQVAVFKSPDADFTRLMGQILMTAEFKPGLCHGVPCRMDYPLNVNLLPATVPLD